MTYKHFKSLSRNMQTSLRREYKLRYTDEYNYSIHLFCLYVVAGMFCLLSLLYGVFYNCMIGFGFFIGFFLVLLLILYYLKKSNQSFYDFLTRLERHTVKGSRTRTKKSDI